MWFLLGEVSSFSGALDGLYYFIVALPEPSLYYSDFQHKNKSLERTLLSCVTEDSENR